MSTFRPKSYRNLNLAEISQYSLWFSRNGWHRNLGAVSNHAANPLDLFHLPALKQQYTWEVSKFADTVIFTMTMENMSMYDKRNSQFERKRPAIKCQY